MHAVAWWPTTVVMVAATYTDLRYRRIPNLLVLPFMLAGFVMSSWLHGWHGLGQSFLGCTLGLLVYGTLAFMGGMGMGDVKLFAAVGAWVGPQQLLLAMVLIGLVGGVMALAWAIKGGFLGELFTNTGDLVFGSRRSETLTHADLTLSNPRARKMPYAPAIAIGTLFSFFAF